MKAHGTVAVFALLAFSAVAAANTLGGGNYGLIEQRHPIGTILHLNDDILLQFGNTSAAPDVWCEFDTSASPDEFACTTTDADGGGTDQVVLRQPSGTNDWVARDRICFGNATSVCVWGSSTMSLSSTGSAQIQLNSTTLSLLGVVVETATSGVRITDDQDGALQLQGLGNGNDEGIKINLDDTSDVVVITSETGVATWDFQGMSLMSVGLITTTLEANLTAGACTAGTWKVDNTTTRELCRCNDAGTAYDCVSVTTANGPTD